MQRVSTKSILAPFCALSQLIKSGVGVLRMLAFATLGSQTTNLLPPGKAHLRESAQDGARVLETRTRDMRRRRIVRQRVMSFMPWRGENDEDTPDPIDQAADTGPTPAAQIESHQMMESLEIALGQLPARQRQAFLLRNIEGLDVAETAAAMKCSPGGVKTHYFRALQALRSKLGEFAT